MLINRDPVAAREDARIPGFDTRGMQPHRTHDAGPSAGRRAWAWPFVLLVLGAGPVGVQAAAQTGISPTLSGTWRLHESAGDLPGRAARALDGSADTDRDVTIQVDQADGRITVHRLEEPPALLRVMTIAAATIQHQVPRGGPLDGRAERRNGVLVSHGDVAVRQGLLRRQVPFEETWEVGDGGRMLTVTTMLKTPFGVKRRTQVFTRVVEQEDGRVGQVDTPGDRRATRTQKNLPPQ
jgi:hypothetical protein